MALVLLNFRVFSGYCCGKALLTACSGAHLGSVDGNRRMVIVGGVLPGRLLPHIPCISGIPPLHRGKKGWKRPLLFIQFAGVAFISGLMCVVMAQYQYVLNKDMGNPQRLALANAYWNKEKNVTPLST